MFSIVIPTLFYSDRIFKTLMELSRLDVVGEIILIDNTNNKIPFKLEKLVHVLEGENIFVNQAWNKGVTLSNFNKICLLNDDIWFDWSFLQIIDDVILPDLGFIGMHPDNFQARAINEMFFKSTYTLEKPLPDGKTKNGYRPLNWGTCIFFDKRNWDPIPSNLRIWAGDDWLFYRSSKQNLIIHGLQCHGTESTTINKLDVEPILKQDMQNMVEWVKKGEIDNYLLNTIWWKN